MHLDNHQNTDFWKQFPWTTKVILIMLLGIVVILSILILIRVGGVPGDLALFRPKRRMLDIPSPEPNTPYITAPRDVNVFGNPIADYEIISRLQKDQSAQVAGISPDGEWWVILVPSNPTGLGWVSTAEVSSVNTQDVPIIEQDGLVQGMGTSTPGSGHVTANVDTDILVGPGDAFGQIGVLLAGERAEVIGLSQDNAWWIVKVPYVEGGQGWVTTDDVLVDNPNEISYLETTVQPPLEPFTPENQPVLEALTNVNIRSGPDIQYRNIGLLRSGETSEVVGVSADRFWWAIAVPFAENGRGWVSADYVKTRYTEDVPIIEPQSISAQLIVPTSAGDSPRLTALTRVNIRSGPGVTYEILGRLEAEQTAQIVGITPDGLWWVIRVPSTGNGRGWVSANFVQAVDAEGVEVIK